MHKYSAEYGQEASEQRVDLTNGQSLRAHCIDNEYYVSLSDFGAFIQDAVRNIVELARVQQEHVEAMEALMTTFTEVLDERYPDLREELMTATQARLKMA